MENQFENFADYVTAYLPNVLGAILVLIIGWLIAKGFKKLIIRLMQKTNWDERALGQGTIKNTNEFVGNIVYYILMVIVLLAVLEILGIDQVLDPLKNMVDKFLSFIPDLVGAVLIGLIGYLLAKFISNLVSIGGGLIDRIIDKTGFKDTDKLVNILKKVVFIIIFVPFLIQAFNALNMEAISEPANNILYNFTNMLGEIAIAALILVVFIWGGKYLANFLKDLFQSMGMDRIAEKIKINSMLGPNQSLSGLVANIIYFFLVFFGVITAVEILGLDRLTETLDQILEITGQILFGLIILAIGNYISLMIYNTMTRSNNNKFIAGVMRVASLALFIAIALRTMGIANEIVELAFGLTLGAIAVTIALSYGLGGREPAGEHFREIIQKMKHDSSLDLDPPVVPKPNVDKPNMDRPHTDTPNRDKPNTDNDNNRLDL